MQRPLLLLLLFGPFVASERYLALISARRPAADPAQIRSEAQISARVSAFEFGPTRFEFECANSNACRPAVCLVCAGARACHGRRPGRPDGRLTNRRAETKTEPPRTSSRRFV